MESCPRIGAIIRTSFSGSPSPATIPLPGSARVVIPAAWAISRKVVSPRSSLAGAKMIGEIRGRTIRKFADWKLKKNKYTKNN